MASQQGEDEFISCFFRNRKPARKTFCDVGALDGIRFSNTRALLDAGWTGVFVEPNPRAYAKLAENVLGRGCLTLNAAVGDVVTRGRMVDLLVPEKEEDDFAATCVREETEVWKERPFAFVSKRWDVVKVPLMSLREVLDEFKSPVDFMSIDCEGMDVEVFRGARFRKDEDGLPMLFIIEYNGKKDVLETLKVEFGLLRFAMCFDNDINAGFSQGGAEACSPRQEVQGSH